MKKFIYMFVVLCFLLGGCSAVEKEDIKIGQLKVGEYNSEKANLTRTISKGDMYVRIVVENYQKDPQYTFTLYKDGEAIEAEEGVLLADVDMDLIRHNGVLQIKEHVYYYDKEDAANNFAYNQISDVLLQPVHEDLSLVVNVKTDTSKDLRWEVFEVLKATSLSFKTGVFNPKIIYTLYTYFTTLFGIVFAIYMFVTVNKYTILKEKAKRPRVLDATLIVLFILVLFADYSDYNQSTDAPDLARKIDAIFKTCLLIGMMIRLFITIKIKKEWIKNPNKEIEDYGWVKEVNKRHLTKK